MLSLRVSFFIIVSEQESALQFRHEKRSLIKTNAKVKEWDGHRGLAIQASGFQKEI